MANYIVQKESLEIVADSIRAKAGTSGKLVFPHGWKAAVDGITGGGSSGGGDGSAPDGSAVTFGYENGEPVEREEQYAITSADLNELGKIVQGVANTTSLLTVADMRYWLSRARFIPQAYATTEISTYGSRLSVSAMGE